MPTPHHLSLLVSHFLYFGVCILGRPLSAADTDWPSWRGPSRNGVTRESSRWNGTNWPLKAPAWKKNVGEGASSPLVIAGRVYVMGWRGGNDMVFCLDAASGKEQWKKTYSAPRYGRLATGDEGMYSGPSSTPEFDARTGWLYTLSADGELSCWDSVAGERKWSLNLYERYEVPRRPRVGRSGLRDYGYTSSPLVQGDSLIVEVGAPRGNLVAFDKRSGREQWVSQAKDPAGHNGGPVPMTVAGVACVAVHHFNGLLVTRIDPDHAGETVAEYPWQTNFANNIASLAVRDDSVLMTSEYNHNQMARLKISLSGATRIWEVEQASKVCSPLVHKRHVYWAWQGVHCLDYETGELKWKSGPTGDPGSCLVTSDDRLITWTGNGDLRLVETADRSPDKYLQLAARDGLLHTAAWPHVVLAGGRLFCKDREGNLLCFELGAAAK